MAATPPIVPKQSAGPFDNKPKDLFNKPWYLYFDGLTQFLAYLAGLSGLTLPFITPEQSPFNAVGNGVVDDTAALQACINDGRAVVLRRDATYAVSSLTLPSGLDLFGFPGATIRQEAYSAGTNVPFITNAIHSGAGDSNLSITGVTFDGNSAEQTATGVDTIYLNNVEAASFHGCFLVNSVRCGINGTNLRNILIDEDCHFSNWGNGNVGAIYLHADAGNFSDPNPGLITGVRVKNIVCDGTVSHSSCVKLEGSNALPISQIEVSGNLLYPGDDGIATLGIELYSPDGSCTGFANFTVGGNTITAENSTNSSVFGISLGGSGGSFGSVVGNTVKDCGAFGIETIASFVDVMGNESTNCGQWTVDAGATSLICVNLSGNSISNPKLQFGARTGIHAIAHTTVGGPWNIDRLTISNNRISSASSANNLLVMENQTAGSITNVIVSGNQLDGGGFGSGISIGSSAGVFSGVTVEGNTLSNLAIGINQSGTHVNYLFNRFSAVVANYGSSFGVTDCVVEIDETDSTFVIQALKIRGIATETLPASGDIVLPSETAGLVAGINAPANPNVVVQNAVNFGTAIQGGIRSVNSRWAGSSNWVKTSTAASSIANFIVEGAEIWGVMFGNAANSLGANPGTFAFTVRYNAGSPEVIVSSDLFTNVSANKALQTDSTGKVVGVAISAGGITQLTGDVTAGPGSGSVAATVVRLQGGIVLSGTPSSGQVLTATSSAAADWQTPSASPSFPAWTPYTPTIGNLSSPSIAASGLQSGKMGFVRVVITGTSNGALPTVTLPFAPLDSNQTFAVQVFGTGKFLPAATVLSGSTIQVNLGNAVVFTLAVSYTIWIQGAYETT